MDGGEGGDSRGRCCALMDRVHGAFGWPEDGTEVYKEEGGTWKEVTHSLIFTVVSQSVSQSSINH